MIPASKLSTSFPELGGVMSHVQSLPGVLAVHTEPWTVIKIIVTASTLLHYSLRRDPTVPVAGLFLVMSGTPSLLLMFCLVPLYCSAIIYQCAPSLQIIPIKQTSLRQAGVAGAVFGSVLVLFWTLLAVVSVAKDGVSGVASSVWTHAMMVTSLTFLTAGHSLPALSQRLFFMCIIVCLTSLMAWRTKHAYVKALLALFVPQLVHSVRLIYMYDIAAAGSPASATPSYLPGDHTVDLLHVISILSLVLGLMYDIVLAHDEATAKLIAVLQEGEGLSRRITLEITEQNEQMRKAFANRSEMFLERQDFLQRLVSKISGPASEVMHGTHQLLENPEMVEWQLRCVQEIQLAGEELSTLLTDVKYLVAVESGTIGLEDTTFSVADLIEDSLEHVSKDLSQPDVELVYEIEESVPSFLRGDPSCIAQVLEQLLHNGIKFTEQGEVGIRVSCTNDPQEEELAILIFEVYDTGIGMTEQELAQSNMFMPFPSFSSSTHVIVNARRRGSGLGLVVCEKLVRLLDGFLVIEGIPNGGTSFRATVSLRTASPPSMYLSSSLRDPHNLDVLRELPVLVIEDNDSARFSIEKMLREFGCTVTCVSSGVAGLRELKFSASTRKLYKVVMIDYHMAGMDGLDTVHMLKEDVAFSDLRIVLLLSPVESVLRKYRAKSEEKYSHTTCLMKPITRTKVMSAVLRALGEEFKASADKRTLRQIGSPQQSTRPTIVSLNPLRVLIVGDREQLRQTQALVERLGHLCTFVPDGVAAVAAVKKNSAIPFDLIIMNINMPVLDGVGAAQMIRHQEIEGIRTMADMRPSRTPIVGVAVQFNEQEKDRAQISGIDEYVVQEQLLAFLQPYLADLTKRRFADKMAGTPKTHSIMANRRARLPANNTPPATPPASTPRVANPQLSTLRSESGGRRSSDPPVAQSDSKLARRVEELESVISRFVPKEFQDLFAPQGMENVVLGDCICRNITIFFSDIRDFTSLTEKMPVHKVIDFLNTYVAFALPALSEKGGFIDKFIGDAIMAIFPHPGLMDQASAAVSAAVGMMKSLDFMRESGFDAVESGIGINTGKTIVGIVGTETRMEPTALGDAVNLASRTEALCKQYGARILITGYTREAMGDTVDMFMMRFVDSVTVKGKSEACEIYEVIDGDQDDIQQMKRRMIPFFHRAIESFQRERYLEAYDGFRQCLEIYPDDKPSKLYVERIQQLLEAQQQQQQQANEVDSPGSQQGTPNSKRVVRNRGKGGRANLNNGKDDEGSPSSSSRGAANSNAGGVRLNGMGGGITLDSMDTHVNLTD
eukprot:TRINITY_DN4894_c0_g1_i5.p1 TRINITY_DN4894_c0_g1~~TRINITY_DN4894_c0_g1_i5.p1  ORF type:complete len:1373 (+),score=353.06 TRINITY_DN4894_c0_g1_i5:251-4120(+)